MPVENPATESWAPNLSHAELRSASLTSRPSLRRTPATVTLFSPHPPVGELGNYQVGTLDRYDRSASFLVY